MENIDISMVIIPLYVTEKNIDLKFLVRKYNQTFTQVIGIFSDPDKVTPLQYTTSINAAELFYSLTQVMY